MHANLKVLLATFASLLLLVVLVFFFDLVQRKYFFTTTVTACFDNCSQYICDAPVKDESVFTCMDSSTFTDAVSAQNYFMMKNEVIENTQLKNADCFDSEPVLYKECSVLDRVLELL